MSDPRDLLDRLGRAMGETSPPRPPEPSADDLWVLCPINAQIRPWICTRCAASVVEGPPMHEFGGLKPREAHTLWHARQDREEGA